MGRQESPTEGPEIREGFRHPALLEWLGEHRGELGAAQGGRVFRKGKRGAG